MKLLVFSVFDKAVDAYAQPFYARSKGEAIRSFTEACSDEKHVFSRNALDYTLMYLGEFDDNAGMFTTDLPERLLSATEALPRSS